MCAESISPALLGLLALVEPPAPLLASDYAWMTSPWCVVTAIYAVMSAVTFLVFSWDKWSAQRGRQRIPESTLHLLELFGGWPGALLAQRFVRHKSAKQSFIVVLWCIIALHIAGWITFVYLAANVH